MDMKSLLDNNGVKRLVSNIKDWAENKFVDSKDREYSVAEIYLLVRNSGLKAGNTYIINCPTTGIEYDYNIGLNKPYYYIYLRAINSNTFDKKAIMRGAFVNSYYECEFQYGYFIYNNHSFKSPYVLKFANVDYILIDYYESIGMYRFYPNTGAPYSELYIDSLNAINTEIDVFNNPYVDTPVGTGTLYYNGLGTITYLKDDEGNEAPFDFINLNINNKQIIQGSNNIIKSFDPENPIFIEGDNNIIINSKNLNIKESNVVYINDVKQNTKQQIIDLLAYGVEWDTTQPDPDCKRIGNLELHKTLPISSGFRGCLFDARNNKVYSYLKNDDFSKHENDENVAESEFTQTLLKIDTNSDFYLKSEEDGDKRKVWVSQIQIDSSWKKIKRCFIDANRSSQLDNFIGGYTNPYNYDTYPITNLSRNDARAMVENGHLLDYNTYKAIFYWLPVIEYATFNLQQDVNSEKTSEGYLQGGLGLGNAIIPDGFDYDFTPIVPCGISIYQGLKSTENYYYKTINDIEYEFPFCNWRGFEQPFGDIWTNLDGIIIKYNSETQKSDVYVCDEPEYFSDELNEHYYKIGEQINKNGFTGEFDLGEHAEIIPATIGGTSVTKKCDYSYQTTSSDLRTLIVGGNAVNGSYAGLGSFASHIGVGYSSSGVGFRTVHYVD